MQQCGQRQRVDIRDSLREVWFTSLTGRMRWAGRLAQVIEEMVSLREKPLLGGPPCEPTIPLPYPPTSAATRSPGCSPQVSAACSPSPRRPTLDRILPPQNLGNPARTALNSAAIRGSLSTVVNYPRTLRKEPSMSQNVARELSALQRLTVPQLRLRYAEVFHETTNANNRTWLVKKTAWRLQALAEGDLSERARQRVAELAND